VLRDPAPPPPTAQSQPYIGVTKALVKAAS
jgi:hypothetical protein